MSDDTWDFHTQPWDGANELLIRFAHQHTYSVQLYDAAGAFTVDVISCQVTFDVDWSPYVQGVLTIRRPGSATLARLNPRLKVRVRVDAGYVLPGGVTDSHPLVERAWLSRRIRSIDQDTIDLQFQGGEFLVDRVVSNSDNDSPQDAREGWDNGLEAYLAVWDVLDFTNAVSITGGEYLTDGGDALLRTGWVPAGDPWLGRAGDNALDLAREVATRTDLWFRCDEFGDWRLSPFETDTYVKHELRDGADGTVITAADDMSRDGWANWVTVVHNWSRPTTPGSEKSTTTDYSASGYAYVSAGPYAVDVIGRVVEFVPRDSPSSNTLSQTEAANILKRRQRDRGGYNVTSVAAYWLRPGKNVSISVEGGDPWIYVVRAVTFDLDAGSMSARLVQPGEPDAFTTG